MFVERVRAFDAMAFGDYAMSGVTPDGAVDDELAVAGHFKVGEDEIGGGE